MVIARTPAGDHTRGLQDECERSTRSSPWRPRHRVAFNSDNSGSISDFTGSIAEYGTEQPSCYDFKGAGSGKGKCVKNAAASVWNRGGKTVRVYFNSDLGGAHEDGHRGEGGVQDLRQERPAPGTTPGSWSTTTGRCQRSTEMWTWS
ncbi:MAG: peptidase inhibitor family I36 protein [Spirillospora sp.]